jgi:hypothetical protein
VNDQVSKLVGDIRTAGVAKVAFILGVSRQALCKQIQKIEGGKIPHAEQIEKLSKALRVISGRSKESFLGFLDEEEFALNGLFVALSGSSNKMSLKSLISYFKFFTETQKNFGEEKAVQALKALL